MKICRTIAEMRALRADWRAEGLTVALVPTMGFLHAGHMALVRGAEEAADKVVAWIFVNPTQFENASDLEAYPRDEARDLAMLEAEGVDAVFLPDAAEIYPDGAETIVECTHLSNVLHGKVRPGHFRGVTTVVTKFFNIVQPDFAMFGEKDYQQLQIIRRMVRDLHMPIEIIGVPTVREPDGLAMSSRNVRLGPKDRVAALALSRALDAAEASGAREGVVLRDIIETVFQDTPGAQLVGLDIVEAHTLKRFDGHQPGPIAIMLSAQVGPVLLIDQREIHPKEA